MKPRRALYWLRRYTAIHGARWTARYVLREAAIRLRGGTTDEPRKSCLDVHPFDRQFGVETSGVIAPEDLHSGSRSDLFSSEYIGVPPSLFRSLLTRLELDYGRFTFVDLGSGKGRALMLASGFPFREVIGVELSPDLHEIACANLERFPSAHKRCNVVQSLRGDATEFCFPHDPLVLYMWNPFCEPVLRQVLANLEASLEQHPRDVFLLYADAGLDRVIEKSPKLSKLWSAEVEMSDEDYAANPLQARSQHCSLYRNILRNAPATGT